MRDGVDMVLCSRREMLWAGDSRTGIITPLPSQSLVMTTAFLRINLSTILLGVETLASARRGVKVSSSVRERRGAI